MVTMRQETGSNPQQATKKVSIQVKLGGRSFSADNYVVADDIAQVEFIIDTPRVTLAPSDWIEQYGCEATLREGGKASLSNESCVCSDIQAEIVAAIAIDCAAHDAIVEKWGSRTSFTSPLLNMRHSDKHCLTIDASEHVCYIRLFENGLQRAEAYDISTEEDILYLASEWLEGNDIPIYIKGNAEAAKLLRKYYKHVICE